MTQTNEDIAVSRVETMPDWKCSFCNSINPSNTISCTECHKTREESDTNFFQMLANDDLKTVHPAPEQPGSLFRFPVLPDLPKLPWRNARTLKFAGAALLVLLLSFAAWRVFRPSAASTATYKVAEVKWERVISVERFAIRNKKQPNLKSYAPFRLVRAEGKDNNPQWPNPELGRSADGKPDKEGKRSETYSVRLDRAESADKYPRSVTFTTSEIEFRETFVLGKTIFLQKDNKGNLLPISKDSSIVRIQK